MVRDGTDDDIEKLLPLAIKMHETSIYKGLELDLEVVRKYAKGFIKDDWKYFRVYVGQDEVPSAFFMGFTTNYFFNNQVLGCEENLFTNEKNPFAGIRLTKDFEKWCKKRGAVEMNFSVTHSGKPNGQYHKFMKRMGYQEIGAIFKKRI